MIKLSSFHRQTKVKKYISLDVTEWDLLPQMQQRQTKSRSQNGYGVRSLSQSETLGREDDQR